MSSQGLVRIGAQASSILFLAVLFCFFQTNAAIAQQTDSSIDAGAQDLIAKPNQSSASSRGARTKADRWSPDDIDLVVPPVEPGKPCPLSDVLLEAGKRIQELGRNVDKFTATEVVKHQSVDRSGRFGAPQIRKFNYVVSIAQTSSGNMDVTEYRDGRLDADFPDHIETIGTPSLVLIFHPHHVGDFQIKCEGLGQWQGQPAWQVRFEERSNRANSISTVNIDAHYFNVRLRGRAWILADSYQVARLESDLAYQLPQIRLRLQRQNIEYRPVPLPESKGEIWLPSSTELYMDFLGHRFYRQHSFTDLKFFSVKVQQTFGNPKE